MNITEFANTIKQYRKEHSLSQSQLAEKLFVTQKAVSKWETGKGWPDITSLCQLSDIMGISLDKLLKNSENSSIENNRVIIEKKKRYFSLWFLIEIIYAVFLLGANLLCLFFAAYKLPVLISFGGITLLCFGCAVWLYSTQYQTIQKGAKAYYSFYTLNREINTINILIPLITVVSLISNVAGYTLIATIFSAILPSGLILYFSIKSIKEFKAYEKRTNN